MFSEYSYLAISCINSSFINDRTYFTLCFLCITYLFSSIPFGLILTRISGYGDIRNIGSGNIGATNVLRTGNKKLALLTLILDALKGVISIILFYYFIISDDTVYCHDKIESFTNATSFLIIGLAAILGHCFPVWLKFKGGKGVATSLGVLLAAVPFTGLIACATWIISAKAGKISSVAAISAMIVAPVMTYVFYGPYPALINVLISALVIYRHKDNIKRIRQGTEPKIGAGKNKPAAEA